MKTFIQFVHLFLVSLLLLSSRNTAAQEWQWKWGAPNDMAIRSIHEIVPMGTDRLNRVGVGYTYTDSLFLHDTVFRHNTGSYVSNVALAFYGNDGTFVNAVDIYSNPNGNIWHTLSRTDSAGNLYIACEFQVRAFLNGTVINHGPGPYTSTPDIFIAKLGPDKDVKWVRLIWGSSQSTLNGLEIGPDQQIFLATSHYGNGGGIEYINYFGADSSYFSTSIQSILKVDTEGSLMWRKEIRSTAPGADARFFLTGEDGNIYHLSNTGQSYYIGPDTVPIPPGHPQYTQFPCLLSFTPDGDFLHGQMLENRLNITDLKVDSAGELYFSGYYWDTAYIANDTLIVGADSTGSLLGKADANFEILWYQAVKSKIAQVTPIFHIVPDAGDLYFAATFMRTFQFAGQTFHFGNSRKPLIGKLLPGGILENYTIGPSTSEMYANDLIADNCKNLILTGMFSGNAYLGKDTLHGAFSSQFMGFLQIHPPMDAGLGTDTSVCQRVMLHAAPGFSYYSWNNGASMADSIEVTETGWYSVTMHNENYCWASDSMFVTVIIPPDRLLGDDTSMYRRDSLELNLTVPFDHCLWSTGDTTVSVLVKGAELGTGYHTVFVRIETGPCEVSDSIKINVLPNPGLDEAFQEGIYFYPNPVDNNILIRLPQGDNKVTLFDTDGKILLSLPFNDKAFQTHEIGLSFLPKGVYFLQVLTGREVRTGKLIKQ